MIEFMDRLIQAGSDTLYELYSGGYVPPTQRIKPLRIKPKPKIISKNVVYKPKRSVTEAKEVQREIVKQSKIPEEPFIEPKDEGTWNTILDPEPSKLAEERIKIPKSSHKTTHSDVSPARKQFLFLNLSDNAILRYIMGESPPWSRLFPTQLKLKGKKAYFNDLEILLKDKRRNVIKECYFNPAKPTSQYQIHAYLHTRYANITRKQVARTLHSLETYQRLRTRKLPKNVTGRIEVFSPGTLSCDTFYPSTKHGWPSGTIILSCTDMWSRFVGCYVLGDKEAETAANGFEHFIHEFMKHSRSPPKKLLLDKGTELRGLDKVMEKFTKERPCVWRSLTGQPCNMIENVNANVQRKMQIYQEAGVVSSFEDCLWLVCNSINNEKRKDRLGYTPIELLGLNKSMRFHVNSNYRFRTNFSAEQDPLEVGEYVRVLQLNRKEQVSEKTKGFPAHWSRTVYIIVKRVAVIQNKGRYKYFLEDVEENTRLEGSRFRHEILKLKINSLDDIDRTVPNIDVTPIAREKYYMNATGDKGDYDPLDDM